MRNYITIDGGTSNTRVSLIRNGVKCNTVKLSLGARAGIDQRGAITAAVREAIADLLQQNALTERDIHRVLAAGMITSEFGLYHLPHIETPAGIAELHDTMQEVVLPHITTIPFVFIRGVRQNGTTLDQIDLMRGEETELVGLLEDTAENCLLILPGSHSKLIQTDACGRIIDFRTMLTGEMLFALSQNTILKDAVCIQIEELCAEYLQKGYVYACEYGVNEALFKVRVLKNVCGADATQTYSFFCGAILCDEIRAVLRSDADRVVIGGRKQIREAMTLLLQQLCTKQICCLCDEQVENSVSNGMIRIYEYSAAQH